MKITKSQLDKLIEHRVKQILTESSGAPVISKSIAGYMTELENNISKQNKILLNTKKFKKIFDQISIKLESLVTYKKFSIDEKESLIYFTITVNKPLDFDKVEPQVKNLGWELESKPQDHYIDVTIDLLK